MILYFRRNYQELTPPPSLQKSESHIEMITTQLIIGCFLTIFNLNVMTRQKLEP